MRVALYLIHISCLNDVVKENIKFVQKFHNLYTYEQERYYVYHLHTYIDDTSPNSY